MIKKLEAELRAFIKNSKEESIRLAILGVGSELRCDDAAGVLIAQKIKNICEQNKDCSLAAFLGYTAPENITGEINSYKPTHLIVIDAADLNIKPGIAKILPIDDIGGISFSTHQLPLKIILDYIIYSCHCEVAIIGIQPECLEVAKEPTPKILETVDEIVDVILKISSLKNS